MTNVPKAVEEALKDWRPGQCEKHPHNFMPCPLCMIDRLAIQTKELTAENERLSLENKSLREKIIAAGYLPHFDANEIKDVEQQIKRLLERANSGNAHLMAENERLTAENAMYAENITYLSGQVLRGDEKHKQDTAEIARLTAALVECQEAFESGRAVGAVCGELEY